ncbi:RNA polymerase sigma factor sigV [Sphingobacterium spiritivorum]|uniref:RNA polymerase sigma factor sigV n=1 Tax=Sphingobacterium spiritivorum TaxID=258 RepID=A0A380B9M2_SPHSI|nr:RNA polymerase sigma-70 factor [Sphingobacterium spiritivorum]SUI97743.1 RNA polymerase sigma factor sigV [Sphingobacterium spiritivorum]
MLAGIEHIPLQKEHKFEMIFREHFKDLHRYAFRFLEDSAIAEEVVQQVFMRLWERDWETDIHTSLKAYLYRAVYHESLNTLKREQLKRRYQEYQLLHEKDTEYMDQGDSELKKQLHQALLQLPEKSRAVFEMSRFQDLKYKEIADLLNLSIKTVEGHMSKALRHLRIHLVDYLTFLIISLLFGL